MISTPDSCVTAAATSKRVVSTGNDFWTLPEGVCSRSRVSVYAAAGFEATGPEVVGGAAAFGAAGGARPSRSAFSFSVFSRRSSLSVAIFCLMRSLAAISSCFSRFLTAASLSCSFFLRSSLMSAVSFVLFRRISCSGMLAHILQ